MVLTGGYELLWHPDIINFYEELITIYTPPKEKNVALFLQCTAKKPYSLSKTHRRIQSTIKNIGNGNIHELIVGEPLGVVPRELETKYPAAHYDMVLDSWFPIDSLPRLRKSGVGNDIVKARKNKKSKTPTKIINELADRVALFLEMHGDSYQNLIAYVRGSQRSIIEKASKKSGTEIIVVPSKEDINKIIKEKGTFFWIMNGMRCEDSLKFLRSEIVSTVH